MSYQLIIVVLLIWIIFLIQTLLSTRRELAEIKEQMKLLVGVMAAYFDSIQRPDVAAYFMGITTPKGKSRPTKGN